MKIVALVAVALWSSMLVVAPAGAQSYPAKPIRIIVPFPPGGTSDILSRLLGPKLTEKWGQQIVVENRPGAAGSIGADTVAKSLPDGYTLLVSDVGSLLIYQILYSKAPFDLTRDFAPVTTISYSPHLLGVHPSVPVATIPQLVALAKKRPGALNFASSPAGAPYLAGLQFAYRTGIQWEYITGRGGAQSVMDVMTGQADVLFNGMLATLPHVKSGKIKLIAVTSEKRNANVPDTPTVAEFLPGFLTGSWQGMLAPAGTPPEITTRLHAELSRILSTAEIKGRLSTQGADALATPPAEAAKFLREERDRFTKLTKETGYKLQ